MHQQNTAEDWKHSHNFSAHNIQGERRTQYVLILTAVTMIAEIIAGSIYGSMALLADGWHMSTHVAAFLIAIFAYRYARKHANNSTYTFGTGKVNVLGGFTSAIALAVVALVMLIESFQRIIDPQTIQFNQAIAVASLGLVINIVSAFLLQHDHPHDDHEHHHDHNLHAAYIHVLADALTSVLAIVALVMGKYLGWSWLDPIMGIVGAIIITRWAYSLAKQTGPILLDASINDAECLKIKEILEKDSITVVTDIHIWKIAANHYATVISLVTHLPNSTRHYKNLLKDFHKLSHITIEVNKCTAPNAPSTDQMRND
ncbi:CDF family Co(II)/Ni(II) efflux transporter DmeF [Paremcibacter congregatus]|uniref:CDF family Co(II)/Ni(II) efflux transporter DmeF n=1 Tax=Paremcibacter congregatus TaxID=2043170 RepID=UPI0030ED4665